MMNCHAEDTIIKGHNKGQAIGLTHGVNSQGGIRGITGFSKAGFVHGNDSELVFRPFGQLDSLDGPVDYRSAVNLGPGQLRGLTFLQHVSQDGGLAIVGRDLPADCHGVLGDVSDDWGFTWTWYI